MLSYLSKFHKQSQISTHLKNQDGKISNYFIGIGILVVIIIVAVGAVVLFPGIRNSITPSSQSGESKTKSEVAGEITDLNYDGRYFIIEDQDGETYKISVPEGSDIEVQGEDGKIHNFGSLEIGQYIRLTNVKYTSKGGGNSSGGGSNNNGGGSDNNERGNKNCSGGGDNEDDDSEDIYGYIPFPRISDKGTRLEKR